ncbi:MAG: DUF4468 domain-containing protein [Bacteroidota bacterium]
MKNLFLTVLSLLIGHFGFSQASKTTVKLPIDESTKLITYDKVIEVTNQTKENLFDRALTWAKGYYKNPTEVIREQNKEEGKIVCKGRYKISTPPDKKGFSTDAGLVQYTLTLLFKDGKIKYSLSEINWKQTSYYACEKWMDTSSQYYKSEFEFYLQQVDTNSKEILKSLEKECQNPKTVLRNDNW